jgi:hypothetical protein
MEAAPRREVDPPVLGIVGRPLVGRLRPGRRVGPDALRPMAPRAAGPGLRGRVGVAAAAGPPADPEATGRVVQGQTQLERVRARVAAQARQRGRGVRGGLAPPGADRRGRHRVGGLARCQPAPPQRGGPAGAAAGPLDPPRRVPAGHDGLPMGRPVGRGRVAALRAGCGVAARPDPAIHRRPGRLGRDRLGGAQPLQPRPIHGARVEGIVETAPAARTGRHQPEMGGRFAGGGRQHRVQEFEQGIAAAPKPRLHLGAEGSERFQVWGVQTSRMGSRASPCPLRPRRPIAIG